MKTLKPRRKLPAVTPRLNRPKPGEEQSSGYRVNRSPEAVEREAYYNTQEWRELRQRVIAEEPRCRRCGAPTQHVDHITHGSDWRQRFFDRENLQALCAPCHNSKSGKERGASKQRQKVSKWAKFAKPKG